jgi:hypothetical protein
MFTSSSINLKPPSFSWQSCQGIHQTHPYWSGQESSFKEFPICDHRNGHACYQFWACILKTHRCRFGKIGSGDTTTATMDTSLLFTFFLTLFDLSNSCYNSSFRCIEENWADALICPLGLLLKLLWHRSLLVIRRRNSGSIQSCLGESLRELRITFRVSQGHYVHYCLWVYQIEWSAIIFSASFKKGVRKFI